MPHQVLVLGGRRMRKEELCSRFWDLFGKAGGELRFFFAPASLNLIGEHTNYNGGHVVSCAVNFGTWGVVRLRKDRTMRFASYFDCDTVTEVGLNEKYHPRSANDWIRFPLAVLEVFREWGCVIPCGFDLMCCRDIPLRRSTFFARSCIVLVELILREMYHLPYIGEIDLAVLAQKTENLIVGAECGLVNAFASVMGREGCAILLNADRLHYEYIPMQLGGAS